jgi:hypothetical protein
VFKNIIFGRSGKTLTELHPIHRLTRHAYTYFNVLAHGDSWQEYKDRWMR